VFKVGIAIALILVRALVVAGWLAVRTDLFLPTKPINSLQRIPPQCGHGSIPKQQ